MCSGSQCKDERVVWSQEDDSLVSTIFFFPLFIIFLLPYSFVSFSFPFPFHHLHGKNLVRLPVVMRGPLLWTVIRKATSSWVNSGTGLEKCRDAAHFDSLSTGEKLASDNQLWGDRNLHLLALLLFPFFAFCLYLLYYWTWATKTAQKHLNSFLPFPPQKK